VIFIHSLANYYTVSAAFLHQRDLKAELYYPEPGSTIAHLLDTSIPLAPPERAKALEDSEALESAYKTVAVQGDSAVPESPEDEVDYHYVCFVKSSKNGHIYELDGDRKGPIDHGFVGSDDDGGDVLDQAGLKVVRTFLNREKGSNMNFSLLALVYA
jgi:ubiquitin carboxyl-terminal hydrolase L3